MDCFILKCYEGDVELKEYECVEVKHHKDVGRTIEEYQSKGWRLYTYQVAGMGAGPMAYNVNHYLLFEKDEWLGQADSHLSLFLFSHLAGESL